MCDNEWDKIREFITGLGEMCQFEFYQRMNDVVEDIDKLGCCNKTV